MLSCVDRSSTDIPRGESVVEKLGKRSDGGVQIERVRLLLSGVLASDAKGGADSLGCYLVRPLPLRPHPKVQTVNF